MKNDWCYWMNAFTPEQCDSIVNSALKLPRVESALGYDSGGHDHSSRRSYVRWVNEENPDFGNLFDTMWRYLRTINNEWFNFSVNHLPPMQFTEYDASYLGEYKRHQDIFWVNPTTRHRKVSLVLQLSDPNEYSGGNLTIESVLNNATDDDKKAMRTRGTLIAFTSFTWHALEPVTSGRRYSLVAWFEGPKFC